MLGSSWHSQGCTVTPQCGRYATPLKVYHARITVNPLKLVIYIWHKKESSVKNEWPYTWMSGSRISVIVWVYSSNNPE